MHRALLVLLLFVGAESVAMSGARVRSAVGADIFVEAEGFQHLGGWVVDPQFLDAMGSSYLLAHGLGIPVADARTVVAVSEAGRYRIWVRTKDWVPSHHPGTFQLVVGAIATETVYGNLGDKQGDEWAWQRGDVVELPRGEVPLRLHDLTGFAGRCDAVFLTTDLNGEPPPATRVELARWRRALLGLKETPSSAGDFDVIVVGGGIAGCSATLAAARLGLRVALIQNRPVLGGNASSEIGITPRGKNRSVVSELLELGLEPVLQREPNVTLRLGWHAVRATARNNRILAVDAVNTVSNQELRFRAPVFIDCSGVGAVGHLVGADYRMGREARSEFDERLAPEKADSMHHGNTIVFATAMADAPVSFPEVPWATAVAGDFVELGGQVVGGRDNVHGLTHFWEYGQFLDPFRDGERIRDHLLCALYGTYSNARQRHPKALANLKLQWVGFVTAGGESRRLMGDHILTEQDILLRRAFPDAIAECTGHFCLHYPGTEYDFRLGDWKFVPVPPYSIPYRCLYSRNIENLMMAGKHISVSHVAGASTKTMLNGGQMGVAVGAAAHLCKKHGVQPRDVGQRHLQELKDVVSEQGDYEHCFRRPRQRKTVVDPPK